MISKDDPLAKKLIDDEGYRNYPYVDSEGLWTIGIGHLIDRRRGGSLPDYIKTFPLTDDEVMRMFEEDVMAKRASLKAQVPWTLDLDGPRLRVIISMAFQLGIGGLLAFKKALAALKAGNWEEAGEQFASSKVAKVQTVKRWARHVRIIKTGNEEVA